MDKLLSIVHPLLMSLGYLFFVGWFYPGHVIAAVLLVGLLATLCLWQYSQRLKTRASITRLLAFGEPSMALTLTVKKLSVAFGGYHKLWISVRMGEALFWLGRFSDAIVHLDTINLTKRTGKKYTRLQFKRDWVIAMALWHTEDVDRALSFTSEGVEREVRVLSDREVLTDWNTLRVIRQAAVGESSDCKEIQSMSFDLQRPAVSRALLSFWHALILRKQNVSNETEVARAEREGANSFVPSYAAQLLSHNQPDSSEDVPPCISQALQSVSREHYAN